MDVVMPQLGETVAEGRISAWFKQAGERVEAGEPLFEIETDKVSMEVQALESGTISAIRVGSGETVPVGAVVAVIDLAAPAARAASMGTKPAAAAPSNGHALALDPFAETRTPAFLGRLRAPDGVRVTPLARRLIAEHGLDVHEVAARAGGARRIGRAEVLAARAAPAAGAPATAPAPTGPVEQFNAARRRTAERLAASWRDAPHVFQAAEVDFAAVDRVRRAQRAAFEARHGVNLTYLPFIARAACLAIASFPRVNARLEGDGLAVSGAVHLGIAVDLDHEGLVVPVVRDADGMTVAGLARAIARQAAKAREGRLSPDDLAGGTYTISNNGAYGTLFTAPIINPPQVAILSTDAVRKRPVVVEGADGDAIAIRPVGVVAHSFDHRAFDGAYAASFLGKLKSVLETRDWGAELA